MSADCRPRATRATRAKRTWLLIGVVMAAALVTLGWVESLAREPTPTEAIEPSSAVTVFFVNHGEATQPVAVLIPSSRADDPVLSYAWREAAELQEGILAALELAHQRGAQGQGRLGRRRAALDLIFASNHSQRIVVPGADGARVGEIIVDRSQPSPGRAGLAAALDSIAISHAGRYPRLRVHTVFLLSCGSQDDVEDVARVIRAFTAITGARPARILTTSDKVVPYYWHIAPGFAADKAIEIFEMAPNGSRELFLRIKGGGWLDLASGKGVGLERPHRP